ncbi:MAG: sigma 54-interacting transcriptional regulator, partial [Polyangiaceae bacterium]
HEGGVFAGASSAREGLFVEANGGTLFLDAIGEMSLATQAKLLKVLDGGKVRAVGATNERDVDVRIVAATHCDLRERVQSGRFREDLLHRLEVVTIELPPLRHRRDDLPVLIDHFLERTKEKHPQSPVQQIARDALDRLLEYSWPGNVRELELTIERLVLLGRAAEATASDLPASFRAKPQSETAFTGAVLPIQEVQRRYATWAYEQLGGRKTTAAEQLGIDGKTLAGLLSSES